MRNVKQLILIFTSILTIISVVIMILLSSCCDNVIRITTDDSEKVKTLQPDDERVIRGDVSYKEAIRCLYMKKHRSSYQFDDTFRFYDNGHYYKAFYSVYSHSGQCGHSSCGIVHDPDCPCHKSD